MAIQKIRTLKHKFTTAYREELAVIPQPPLNWKAILFEDFVTILERLAYQFLEWRKIVGMKSVPFKQVEFEEQVIDPDEILWSFREMVESVYNYTGKWPKRVYVGRDHHEAIIHESFALMGRLPYYDSQERSFRGDFPSITQKYLDVELVFVPYMKGVLVAPDLD